MLVVASCYTFLSQWSLIVELNSSQFNIVTRAYKHAYTEYKNIHHIITGILRYLGLETHGNYLYKYLIVPRPHFEESVQSIIYEICLSFHIQKIRR